MARAKVIHSQDACMIQFRGDVKNPEPSTGVIKFPGGHVEVSRCSDGSYWAHLSVDDPENTIDSRLEHDFEGYKALGGKIPPVPEEKHVKDMALKIKGPFKEF